ncbi:PLP-dependent aminotransferase family protein [Labrys okinawensis]|uniref:MocR-like pyridoxine biosynthesis transcription factor PdxR n=1 Tax=Labrys okinawensis TaxID=346911 RepID=UPI0039BC283D
MVKRAGGALLQSITIDHASSRTIGIQLTTALRDLILGGGLAAGERLPASRILAKELGIARMTVIGSFEQLTAEGLLESRTGAGTFVSEAVQADRPATPSLEQARPVESAPLARLLSAASHHFVHRLPHEPRAFTTAMPAFDAFPMAQWSRIVARHWRSQRHHVLGYPEPHGHRPLRHAIAAHLRANRGITCRADEIFIVSGAQQAFDLIGSTLVDPGDRVWFENPGTIGARNSFLAHGAEIVPVPVDDDGLVVAEGLARSPDFKLAFVTPSHQQPLGSKMSLERRFALLQAATTAGGWVIEDDWDGEFFFHGRPLPTLKGVDAAGRVIYVGTFSKTLFPALRLGFILAPPALVRIFETSLEAFSPGVPTSLQDHVSDFIGEGHFAAHVRRMRKLYAERCEALLEAGARHLTPWLEIVPTNTGLHTVAWLKGGLRGTAVSAAAARRNLTVAAIERFCIEPIAREGLVLGFGGINAAKIEAGAKSLALTFAELSSV